MKQETTEEFIARGGFVKILKPFKPEIKDYVGKVKKQHKRGTTK